jgi:O-antigen ligase
MFSLIKGALRNSFNQIIAVLAVSASFLLIFRTGNIKNGIIKPFDLILLIIGSFLVLNWKTVEPLKEKLKPFVKYGLILLLSIVLGQIASWIYRDSMNVSIDMLLNYGRIVFNISVFLVMAIIIHRTPKLYIFISRAIFVSPVVFLPVFFGIGTDAYFNGGRLSGFLQDPNVFGGWMIIIFLLGIAFLHEVKARQKILIAAWLCIIANFILWSGSRASWLALSAALLAWMFFDLWRKQKTRVITLIFIPIIAFSVGFLLLPNNIKPFIFDRIFGKYAINAMGLEETFKKYNPGFTPSADYGIISNQTRTKIWGNIVTIATKSPLFGFGFYYLNNNQFPVQSESVSYTANVFLEALINGGIVALAAFLFMLKRIWDEVKHSLKGLSELEFSWIVAIFATLIDLFFIDGFLFRYFWFVLGMGLGIAWARSLPQKAPGIE